MDSKRTTPHPHTALAIVTGLALCLVAGAAPHAVAFTPPTFDGRLDDVYLQYGTATRYIDANTYACTGETNVPGAYLYLLEDDTYIYIFYHQDMFYANDNSYGENSMHWEARKNGKRNYGDIEESDLGEFIFEDAIGTIAAHFYVDQISTTGGGVSGEECLGFSGDEGVWLDGPVGNQPYFEITSGMDYNLNSTGYCSGGTCACGTTTDLLADSPLVDTIYQTNEAGCEDWQWENGWEIRVDKQAFGILGFGVVIGNHHNSPTKMCRKGGGSGGCPDPDGRCSGAADLLPADSSIGDRVWYDVDSDGIQDAGEPGLQGVTVNLIDARDGRVIESQATGFGGRYLFQMLANEYYIVEVDESTLPTGFLPTFTSDFDDYKTTYVNNVCGADCIVRDGNTYDRIYYIDLDIAEAYRAADFGYRPSGAAIGDYVWSDADDDGVQDGSEPGIGGVLLELLDSGGVPTGATTTTNATGWYLFAGLSAGEYRVRVAASNFVDGGALDDPDLPDTDPSETDYALTVGPQSETNPTTTIFLNANDVYPNADFGFYRSGLGTIGDRVWFDSDGDGTQDAGEAGVDSVTLDLYIDSNQDGELDPGEPVIGSTTTVSGDYLFTGLALDQHYNVTVSDRNGVLDGWEITSYDFTLNRYNDPYPVHLTAATPDVLTADFGYNRDGAIGDTVWFDADQDGVQDPGEPGVGGVTVTLSGAASGTTTTAADGTYLFTDLPNGSYQVQITIPAGYSLSTGTPNNPHSCSLTNNESYLDADFGLWRADLFEVGDYVWNDENGDGIQDALEPAFGNVTVALFEDTDDDQVQDPTEPIIGTTTTDGSGGYLFTGLAAGSYIVVVTDDHGVLSGYEATSGPQSVISAYPVDDLSGNRYDVDFGYNQIPPVPTLVSLASFGGYEEGGRVVVEWKTASEVGTVGFYLERRDPGCRVFRRVTDGLLPGVVTAPQGGTYRWVDEDALPTRTYAYRLVEVEARGVERTYGPFSVLATGGWRAPSQTMVSSYFREANPVPGAGQLRSVAAREGRDAAESLRLERTGDAIKISVPASGLYWVGAADIAARLGMPVTSVQGLIRSTGLALSNRGRSVAYLAADQGDGILFYGEAVDSIYTRDNVYWLRTGPGWAMEVVEGLGPIPVSGDQTYRDVLHVEQDRWAMTALFDDPEADFWAWDYVIGGAPGLDTATFALAPDALAAEGEATLSVRLHGGTDTVAKTDHHVVVTLNGYMLGETWWDGTEAESIGFTVDQALLDGDDGQISGRRSTVEVRSVLDTGAPYSMVFVDSIELEYRRHYQAVGDVVEVRGEDNGVVTVSGFSSPDILVFDVTSARRPKCVDATTVDSAGGGFGSRGDGYRVSFRPASPYDRYLVSTRGAVRSPSAVVAALPSSLRGSDNSADYLVITPLELRAGAESLAEYRRWRGLDAMVVNLEQIHDEFNAGISSPHAVRDLLSHAFHYWNRAPRYVVLLGEGTYDYVDNLGFGDNLMPPLLVSTPYGLFASDTRLADVTGDDGVPEMAVGRLPVVTESELEDVVAKIRWREGSDGEPWMQTVLMVADNADDAGDFPVDSDRVAALLPPAWHADRVYLSHAPVDASRVKLASALADGATMLNYIGHGGVDRLATEGLLLTGDVPMLGNERRLPVMAAMTCVAGRFAIPGYNSLAESLVLSSDGGVVAAWAPSGLSLNDEAVVLDEAFFQAVFVHGEVVLGDAVMTAFEEYADLDSQTFILEIYNLLGDPALELQ